MPANVSLLFWLFDPSIAWEVWHTVWRVRGENLQVSCLLMVNNISRNFGKKWGDMVRFRKLTSPTRSFMNAQRPDSEQSSRFTIQPSEDSPTSESNWFHTVCGVSYPRMEGLIVGFISWTQSSNPKFLVLWEQSRWKAHNAITVSTMKKVIKNETIPGKLLGYLAC